MLWIEVSMLIGLRTWSIVHLVRRRRNGAPLSEAMTRIVGGTIVTMRRVLIELWGGTMWGGRRDLRLHLMMVGELVRWVVVVVVVVVVCLRRKLWASVADVLLSTVHQVRT